MTNKCNINIKYNTKYFVNMELDKNIDDCEQEHEFTQKLLLMEYIKRSNAVKFQQLIKKDSLGYATCSMKSYNYL